MGERGDAQRAACFTFWFHDHNNVRYASLFPRLTPLVRFYTATFSRRRVLRAVQFRLWRAADRRLIYPAAAWTLRRRHRVLFTVDARQIPFWAGDVIADVDDPMFDPDEIHRLTLPQVRAIVVTSETAKFEFRRLGVDTPIHVIPQGVSVDVDPLRREDIRRRFRTDGDIVVGYLAPTLTLLEDGPRRFRDGLDDLDFLLSAVEEARKTEPRLRLWLLGRPSSSVTRAVRDRHWVTLFDFVPLTDVFSHMANFDIGVYPRAQILPRGRYSVKLAQYMACGLPVVTTAVSEALVVRDAQNGIVCESRAAFSRALVSLARSDDMRARLGAAGRLYARTRLDWAHLVAQYEAIIGGVLETATPRGYPSWA